MIARNEEDTACVWDIFGRWGSDVGIFFFFPTHILINSKFDPSADFS